VLAPYSREFPAAGSKKGKKKRKEKKNINLYMC
jgi:hypothetical protein